MAAGHSLKGCTIILEDGASNTLTLKGLMGSVSITYPHADHLLTKDKGNINSDSLFIEGEDQPGKLSFSDALLEYIEADSGGTTSLKEFLEMSFSGATSTNSAGGASTFDLKITYPIPPGASKQETVTYEKCRLTKGIDQSLEVEKDAISFELEFMTASSSWA